MQERVPEVDHDDAGQDQRDLGRRGAGVGATVVTPFGPIGFDAAYGFDRTNPGWKFHFKINQAGQ